MSKIDNLKTFGAILIVILASSKTRFTRRAACLEPVDSLAPGQADRSSLQLKVVQMAKIHFVELG